MPTFRASDLQSGSPPGSGGSTTATTYHTACRAINRKGKATGANERGPLTIIRPEIKQGRLRTRFIAFGFTLRRFGLG